MSRLHDTVIGDTSEEVEAKTNEVIDKLVANGLDPEKIFVDTRSSANGKVVIEILTSY